MLFRDGYRSNLPHQCLGDEIISSAREKDINIKADQKLNYISMQNFRNCDFEIGDEVFVRNYQKASSMIHYIFLKSFLFLT